jgi:hypothetical protein
LLLRPAVVPGDGRHVTDSRAAAQAGAAALAINCRPPGVVTADADGTATLYLTGPGQALTVTTGGYAPARAVIGRNRTARAGLEPTRRTMRTQPWARLWAWAGSGNYRAVAGWVLRGYLLLPGSRLDQGGGGDPQIAHITTG